MDLRCPHKKFGELHDLLEVKCSSRMCGRAGEVVIHRFDPLTGELVDTLRFRDPGADPTEEGRTSAAEHDSASIRTA